MVSRRLGLTESVGFTGSLAWPYFHPYPQRPDGQIEECFTKQGRRWWPILDLYEEHGVDRCYEIHPTGDTFEMFLAAVGGHARCRIHYDASHFIKQSMDYLGFIDAYHQRIRMFHVEESVLNNTEAIDISSEMAVFSGFGVPGFVGFHQKPCKFRSCHEASPTRSRTG